MYGKNCYNFLVPLLWNNPTDTRSVNFFVKRLRSTDPTKRKGQVWFLQGGPGMLFFLYFYIYI